MLRISMCRRLPAVWLAGIAWLAVAANAQTAPPPTAAPLPAAATAADPANPQTLVPRAVHSSAFTGYRRQAEPAPIGWRDANDTVTRIGGWRAYAREAAEPSAPAASTPARRSTP